MRLMTLMLFALAVCASTTWSGAFGAATSAENSHWVSQTLPATKNSHSFSARLYFLRENTKFKRKNLSPDNGYAEKVNGVPIIVCRWGVRKAKVNGKIVLVDAVPAYCSMDSGVCTPHAGCHECKRTSSPLGDSCSCSK
jgi:hypothetical protein